MVSVVGRRPPPSTTSLGATRWPPWRGLASSPSTSSPRPSCPTHSCASWLCWPARPDWTCRGSRSWPPTSSWDGSRPSTSRRPSWRRPCCRAVSTSATTASTTRPWPASRTSSGAGSGPARLPRSTRCATTELTHRRAGGWRPTAWSSSRRRSSPPTTSPRWPARSASSQRRAGPGLADRTWRSVCRLITQVHRQPTATGHGQGCCVRVAPDGVLPVTGQPGRPGVLCGLSARAACPGAPSTSRARLTPAVVGLAHVTAGGTLGSDVTSGTGRRFLGWSADRHWMLAQAG